MEQGYIAGRLRMNEWIPEWMVSTFHPMTKAAVALPLNDDRAEKKRRRASAALDRRRSLLPLQASVSVSGGGSPLVGADLQAVAAQQPLPRTESVSTENYEQWMKIAADNVK